MKNIVLIGFMGTGKTCTGRLLASRLNRKFVDIDKKVEHEAGMSIRDIFEFHGQHFFRQLERAVIARVSRCNNIVISTGGGAVLHPENMARLRSNGVLVCLTASLETILERTGRRNTRPLLNRPDREQVVAKLLAERAHLYAMADFTVDTSILSPQQVTERIILFLRKEGHLCGQS